MRVLTVYAHHNPRSFCHAILERFDAGLCDAGHHNEVVDLHAIGFNPVLGDRDAPDWIDDSVPDDVLARMQVRRSMLQSTRNPLRRLLVKRWPSSRRCTSWAFPPSSRGGSNVSSASASPSA